jgi:hypothetical protein
MFLRLAAVVALYLMIHTDTIQRFVPQIGQAQDAFHWTLTGFSQRRVVPHTVLVAAVDNEARRHIGFIEPTPRDFLAATVEAAVIGKAAVIVLDMKFVVLPGFETSEGKDVRLLNAIRTAVDQGIPVVVATWLESTSGGFRRRPGIFDKSDLPIRDASGRCPGDNAAIGPNETPSGRACVSFGSINLSTDKRRIPLGTHLDGGGLLHSLALASLVAYEDAFDVWPGILQEQVIATGLFNMTLPMGTFMPPEQFPTVSAFRLATGAEDAIRMCRGRMVMIGGAFRSDLGYGTAVDMYSTPAGRMHGVYLWANYAEALADGRYAPEISPKLSLTLDVFGALVLHILFHLASTRVMKIVFLVGPTLLMFASYIAIANLNRYLDFVIPLTIYIMHLGCEFVSDPHIHESESTEGQTLSWATGLSIGAFLVLTAYAYSLPTRHVVSDEAAGVASRTFILGKLG